jgi:hypothetical protein
LVRRKWCDRRDQPVLEVDGGTRRGGFKHGQYVAKKGIALCNLFVTMLNTMGLETESFGQSTGNLSW